MARSCTLWGSTALIFMAAALAGCESMPTIPSNALTQALNLNSQPTTLDLKPAPDARAWADSEEEVINNRATGYGLVHMPQVQNYLNGLLQKIRTEAGVPAWPGKVYINASSDLNAYTQSSGNIYISLGLLEQAENEDELVGVLAHEFAHSYLQYDQLQEAVMNTDKASEVAGAVAMVSQNLRHTELAQNLKQEKAMRSAAALLSAYQVGRNLIAPAWSRSQEHAADEMAVQLSIRMGYSVPDGWVKLLERTLAYEKKVEASKQVQREAMRKLFEDVREAAFAQVGSKSDTANVGGAVTGEILGNLSLLGKDLTTFLTSTHPDTDKRIARVNELHDKLMGDDRAWPDPRSSEWSKIKKTRSVQRLFASYLKASQAQALLGTSQNSEVFKMARLSMVQETQGHALPALVGWQSNSKDPTVLRALQANMKSPQHRAWKAYTLYAEHLLAQNKKREAQKVLDDGFQHFNRSALAWQDYIRLQVQLNNTKKAQEMATECAQKFKAYVHGCKRAAEVQQVAKGGSSAMPLDFGLGMLLGR
ncbi:MAG: M48 family metallopeptidase [Comamonas sp.]|nr:M48 family metallopeptidase [Comamonas sp.]